MPYPRRPIRSRTTPHHKPMIPAYSTFSAAIDSALRTLTLYGREVDTGHWQGVPTEGHTDLITLEVLDVAFRVAMPYSLPALAEDIKPNLPWADLEFDDRVSGHPTNPHSSLQHWPWWNDQIETPFTHTYSERFWPKKAGAGFLPHAGIRYEYGDLDDVVELLLEKPHTRQAYLPIFFPEDTGAVHGGRIPCTLGYHFLLRDRRLHLWYEIRSCDAVRHFRDDVYLAARLAFWVLEECKERNPSWDDIRPGTMTFHAHSLHVHKGDLHRLSS